MGEQPSLKRVAQLSGVSVSTVSRVLNDPEARLPVKAETRKRVLEVADSLDYRPNPMVRTIRAKLTNLIAIVGFRDFGAAFRGPSEEAINSFTEFAYEHGYELCTNLLSPSTDPYELPRWRVDGAVVVDCPDAALLSSIENSGTPYVSINGVAGKTGSSVRVDDRHGAADLTAHLLRLGHERIAYVAQDPACRAKSLEKQPHHTSFFNRHSGYLETLQAAGVEPLTPEPPEPTSAREAVEACVRRRGATALIVYDHMTAVKALNAIAGLGLRVPEDVSVGCFNDLFPLSDLTPSVTAVGLPAEEMGRLAAEMLIAKMRSSDDKPQTVVCPEELVIRNSTAAPRS